MISSDNLWPYSNPIEWFNAELKKAELAGVKEHIAMSLATIGSDGYPNCRVVYFKGWYENGLTFFTNYQSEKAKEISINNKVTLNFFWPELAQQIKIRGKVKKLLPKTSEEYFRSRPRLSQLGAWGSRQSQKLDSYEQLEQRIAEFDRLYPNEVPCPPYWGGYAVEPDYFEFWFGREGRLHQRLVFEKLSLESTNWNRYLLNP